MPSTRARFFKCSHRGFGGNCHRCELADKFEAKLEEKSIYLIKSSGNIKLVSSENVKDNGVISGKEAKEILKEEIKRLRALPGRKNLSNKGKAEEEETE